MKESHTGTKSENPLTVNGAILSHPGRVHKSNEDNILFIVPGAAEFASTLGFIAIVADGMGGHSAGELASRIAVETVLEILRDSNLSIPATLGRCMLSANNAIFARSESDPACAGMGTTCTVLVLQDEAIFLAHIGDSRAYLYRSGRMLQISEDHSAIGELVRAGKLSQDDAQNSPYRNIILKSLGTKKDIDPLIWESGRPVQDGDILVICSDGLTDLVDDDALARLITHRSPRDACQGLIDAALHNGGFDNISVGVFILQIGHKQAPGTGSMDKIWPPRPTE